MPTVSQSTEQKTERVEGPSKVASSFLFMGDMLPTKTGYIENVYCIASQYTGFSKSLATLLTYDNFG